MASAKQIAANQANAQQSTGPRTEAGKRIARLNARKHGLSGQTILVTPEEEAAWQSYSTRLMPDLAPGNAIELDFAERIVFASWRLRHAEVLEQNLYALSGSEIQFETGDAEMDDALDQAATFQVKDKTFNLLSLYHQRLQRAIHKDLELLRRMQNERKASEELINRQAESAARQPAAAPKKAPQVTEFAAPSPEIGSVYSTPPSDPAPPPQSAQNDLENMAA